MSPLAHTLSVFLIDDDLATQDILRTLMDHYSCPLTVVGSARAALDYLRQNTPPDIILLDMYLPDGDGYKILKAIRLLLPIVKIIAITAFYTDSTLDEVISKGFSGYQPKPLNLGTLIQYLNDIQQSA